MKKVLFSISALLAIAFSPAANAQMLETVNMDYIGGSSTNTYLTGINNDGWVCGYSNSGGNDVGFVITASGKKKHFIPNGLGAIDFRVLAINDNGLAVVTKTQNGTTGFYKCQFNLNTEEPGPLDTLSDTYQPSSEPRGINNLNDISGVYNTNQHWLYVQHHTTVPLGNSPWEANRVNIGSNFYQTYGGGINDANQVAGFYIDGVNYNSFIYDNLNGTFTELASSNRIKLWDINNNAWVAGEYRVGGGPWKAFIANASGGSYSQWTALDNIFHSSVTYSRATGVNDNNDVVGVFLHPGTNKYVGFIYHPNVAQYEMPSFNYYTSTWGMKNSKNGPLAVWPLAYYQNNDYYNTDPYFTNSTNPLLDPHIMVTFMKYTLLNSTSPTWKAFCEEVDTMGLLTSTDPDINNKYNTIIKPHWFTNWEIFNRDTFIGYCYGMTYSSLLKHFEDTTFEEMSGIPSNTNINAIQNSDFDAIKAIEKFNLKQADSRLRHYPIHEFPAVGVWEGLYNLKNEFRKPFTQSNPAGIGIYFGDMASHSVYTYKIVTPTVLPFDYPDQRYDTMFIYDPNRPGLTNQFIRVNSNLYNMTHDSAYSPLYTDTAATPMKAISFNQPPVRSYAQVIQTGLKTTSGNDYDENVKFALLRNLHYTIKGADTIQATVNNNGYVSNTNSDHFLAMGGNEISDIVPSSFFMDSTYLVGIVTSNYTDSAMVYLQTNGKRSMGISRHSLPSEQDNSSQKNRLITYGNPDNATKYLNLFMTEFNNSLDEGANILATNVCAAQGDSIVTESPAAYTYKISKVNGTGNCIYDLTVHSIHNGEVIKFTGQVELSGNTSHTIDPYFTGNNGEQIAVIIDNGLDGIIDDTLFVAGWPVGMNNILNQGGIKVYPNPVQDNLSIEFATAGNYNILITDVIGRTVYSNTISTPGKASIPMGQHPSGMYLIQVSDEKGVLLLKDKIIKQ